MKKVVLIAFVCCISSAFSQNKLDEKLVGEHMLSLQWISWDKFGKVFISKTEKESEYEIIGAQRSEENSDYLSIEGTLTAADDTEFTFTGVIETRISHINKGEVCKRDGIFKFKVKGKRKYWRLQEINNPCDGVADYVDIYFKQ